MPFSRRGLLFGAAAALQAEDQRTKREAHTPEIVCACGDRSIVSLVQGQARRSMVLEALLAIDDQILPLLRARKRVLIKPNIVGGTGWQGAYQPLAVTHPDALLGILDYLAPRFSGTVTIAEASADCTTDNWAAYGYAQALREYRNYEFVDLHEEGRYQLIHLPDRHLHLQPVRIASRLVDPDAFIICAAMLKTHNAVVATMSVKNMVMGSPLHQKRGETVWNDKRWFHEGVRNSHYSMFLTAQKLAPFWGVALIDGFEGMEGNGPTDGTAVPSRLAIASTDFIAADRIGLECMGIDPSWPGYLNYCGMAGLGRWDPDGIDVRGAAVTAVARRYALHQNIEEQKTWIGDMPDVASNPRLG